jgi:hypothetical protein
MYFIKLLRNKKDDTVSQGGHGDPARAEGALLIAQLASNRKYSSREMPAVFRLVRMIDTATASRVGITTGLATPAFT